MDLFKFTNPTEKTKMEAGELVGPRTSVTWIERFRDAGEVTIVAPLSYRLHEQLTRGCFVSHVDTNEIMVIEDHEINDEPKKSGEVKITGRSLEVILNQRVIANNQNWPNPGYAISPYNLLADYSWNQIVFLINQHIVAANLIDTANALPYIEAITTAVPPAAAIESREIKRGSLYERVLELLAIDNLGIKSVRPGRTDLIPNANTALIIHQGIDRSAKIGLHYQTGDLVSADYLWSTKPMYDSIQATGRWLEVFIDSGNSGIDRRTMSFDVSDIDGQYSDLPTGVDYNRVMQAMTARAREVLAAQKEVALVKATVSSTASVARYRKDYDLGDIVSVTGDYAEGRKSRITEYVEVEDENGTTGYPTLDAV
jgi:hypothetical protein